MTLLIILIGLAVERYVNVNSYLKRFSWFDHYIEFLRTKFGTIFNAGGWQTLLVIVLPILVGFLCVYEILGYWIPSLTKFVIGGFIFVYCLGPENIFGQINSYLNSIGRPRLNDDEMEINHETAALAFPFAEATETSCDYVFEQVNERVLGVVFWFGVLGPLGALAYRLLALMQQISQRSDSPHQNYHEIFATAYGYADWLPARLTALGYALVGNFSDTLNQWLDFAFSDWRMNSAVLRECGKTSVRISTEESNMPESVQMAVALTDRTVILYIIVVALFSLGSWF